MLGTLKAIGQSGWLDQAHTSEEWLQATHRTRYPDAVVAISKFFSWHGSLTALADSRDPDLMVTASARFFLLGEESTF